MTNKITILPLGGLGEIGKNMTAIGYNDEYIIVDAGIAFPEDELFGVDVITPDFSFLRSNKEKIRALFVTHGHEDHIGAIPYFIKEFPKVSIFATPLTKGMILNKLKYHKLKTPTIAEVDPENDSKQFGEMNLSFFRTVHSVYDSMGIVVDTPLGTVVHTGDFKIDANPIDGKSMDLERIKAIREKGVKLLISDSTNARKEGFSDTEEMVAKRLKDKMAAADGRIIVSTFASSLPRIQSIFDISAELNKKVVILGNSMKKNVHLASHLKNLKYDETITISVKEMDKYELKNIVILATGAQGEQMAALNRLANNRVENLRVHPSDTVIFSSGVVPGNEKQVGNLINLLLKNGLDVVQDPGIHTSGHGNKEELRTMLELMKPEYFMPAHGEYRMLVEHKQIAVETGVEEDNIFICENGDILELTNDNAQIVGTVGDTPRMIDDSGLADVNYSTLRDRKRMAEQGIMVVQVKVFTKTKEIKVRIEPKGIAVKINKPELNEELKSVFEKRLNNEDKKEPLSKVLIGDFSSAISKVIKRKPLIIPIIEFIRD